MTPPNKPTLVLATAQQSGAVAIVQLHGPGAAALLTQVTGQTDWPVGRYRLSDLAGADEGLAVRLRDNWVQLMPHGGPRVVQKLLDRLIDLGASLESSVAARQMYPEADSDVEAEVLSAIARAASPAAVDLLLAQPQRWRQWQAGEDKSKVQSPKSKVAEAAAILRRSAVLDRLIDPPTVVVVGQPNVGKSTLTNAMLGRAVSLVADLPGTTRDWVAGLAELTGEEARVTPGAMGVAPGVAVRWIDTPGLRVSGDVIEQEAIALARGVIAAADVLMVMRDPDLDWPALEALPREPDLYVMNKVDEVPDAAVGEGDSADAPLAISATRGEGLDRLQQRILRVLELDAVDAQTLWAFSAPLRAALRGEAELGDYLRQDG